jgi:DNA-binding response OmpR family regulator
MSDLATQIDPAPGDWKILVVDDHGDTVRAMTRLLQARGYSVSSATSFNAALEVAARQSFDLVISDIGLPDGSGLDLMRRLREGSDGISGIALSGYGADEDLTESRNAGFVIHLTKPIDLTKLHAAIEQIRDNQPRRNGDGRA